MKIVQDFLTAGFPHDTDAIVLSRVKVINVINFLVTLFSLFFFFYNILNNKLIFAFIDLVVTFIMLLNFLFLRWHKKVHITALITCFMTFGLAIYLLHLGGAEQAGYVWCVFVPVIAAFLLSLKVGIAVIITFFISTMILILIPENPFRIVEYSDPVKVNFLMVLALISIISIYYEYISRSTRQQLLSNERRYRSLIRHSASVYAIIDENGIILYESQSLKKVYGYEPDELVGKSIFEHVHPDDVSYALEKIQKLITDPGKVKAAEIRYQHKNGNWLTIEVKGVNLLDDPAVKGIILTSHDITGHKQAEDKIKSLNETLEQRVVQRTEELRISEEKLIHSEKMRAIGQLAGGIAHDFNNQLTSILGCADLLRRNLPVNSELYRCANSIVKMTKNAATLTSQLLAFARKGKYRCIPVDFHSLIKEVVSLFERSIDKNITIKQQFCASSSSVVGDPDQFQSMLLNIALNARDAIPKDGAITFKTDVVEYEETDPKKTEKGFSFSEYLKIEIKDTGSGMDKETLKHIFEPFFTTKSRGQGTGMGLAAVYGTVKNHGGTINVESEPDQGTRVTLCLPLSTELVNNDDKRITKTRIDKSNARILFLDDDIFVVKMIDMVLKKLGFTVHCFCDSIEGISWYKKSCDSIDIIVLDMVMPGLTAREVITQLKQINPGARIIITSGYSMNKEVEDLLGSGAAGFIKKPFEITELTRIISDTINSLSI